MSTKTSKRRLEEIIAKYEDEGTSLVTAPPAKNPDISFAQELITPEIARRYLDLNFATNRNLVRRVIKRYAHDMQAGRWRFEASDPIRFDINGHLIDGQHRLHAVIVSGVANHFLIVRGIPVDVVHTFDTGKSRAPADALKIRGYTNTVLFASALRWLLIVKEQPLALKTPTHHSHSDIIAAAERHGQVKEWTGRIRPVRGVRPSQVVAMCYIGDKLLGKPDTAHRFMAVFNSGVPDYEGCPAHRFRENMITARSTKGPINLNGTWTLMMMAHVWNMFARHKPVQFLKLPNQVSIDGLDTDLI
jgi:hypothetical protein